MTEIKLSSKSSKTSPKYLVVDHDLDKASNREGFAEILKLPMKAGIFVESYEEALEAVELNTNIVLAFVDIGVPKSRNKEEIIKEVLRETNLKKLAAKKRNIKNEWGIKLLPQIKNIKTFIYSSRADRSPLREESNYHENVIGCSRKPFDLQDFEVIKPYIEKYFPQEESSPLSQHFDYSYLDSDTSFFVQSRATEIRRLAKRFARDIIDIGNHLIEVKDRLDKRKFYPWLRAEFNWSIRTAHRFMSVAQRFNADTVSGLEFLPSALYELAAPSAPEEAVAEAIERAKQGEIIDKKTAKAIKAKHKALKEEGELKVQPRRIEQLASSQTESDSTTSPSGSQSSSWLPGKKDRAKPEIIAVVPAQNAVKNSWWQLGKEHQLFCGEPKNEKFLKRLPENIALTINFPPNNDYSLIPILKTQCTFSYNSEYVDIDYESLLKMVEECIRISTGEKDTVVFSYILSPRALELAVKLGCHYYVAEPDLEKCEQILAIWREKGFVVRI